MRITQRKGDVAVAQAVATFTRYGFDVSLPLTESAAYDLIVDTGKDIRRVQIKFASGKEVGLRRVHSNSKGYVVKKPLKNTFDWLYVLNSSGEEFLVTYSLAGRNCINPQSKDILASVLRSIKA
ncbi:MAG: hypothetical protein AB200_02130 [Parcubacteria bacterium C7867-005]|nr:MAG: hypothetical protein AB200_02130 [Parcubacteria bacterium C7867-005]